MAFFGRYFARSGAFHRVVERILRSPGKRLSQAARFLGNPAAFLALERDIRRTGLRDLASRYPEYRYKYLGNYLSPAFSVSQRAAILGCTYRFLHSQRLLPFRTVLGGQTVRIWSRVVAGESFEVVLAPVQEAFLEGDLALEFRRNGSPLYRLSFSFMPGHMARMADPTILFIGGSQGYRGTSEESRLAAKRMGEICPATLLLIQLRAIAKALGLRAVGAVSLQGHSCDTILEGKVHPVSAYDAFWEANGATRHGPFFSMPAELAFRPSSASSSSHRARARRKQERKSILFAEILARFGVRPAPDPVPERAHGGGPALPAPRRPALVSP